MAAEPEQPALSFNSQIARLSVGETVATAKRILRDSPEAGDIGSIKAKLRSSINPAVSKARKRYNMEFVTDTGEFITSDGHAVVVITATRIN